MKIILATSNAGKLKEFKSLLAPHEIIAYSEILEPFEIIEDENSFAKNAKIKAKAVYNALLKAFVEAKNPLLDECKIAWQNGDLAVLSDDSGISVEALNGEPGIFSARYSSDICAKPTPASNRAKMIARLNELNLKSSRAFYTAALALIYGNFGKNQGKGANFNKNANGAKNADFSANFNLNQNASQNEICYIVHGFLHGQVIPFERGENGFGYDFMFIADGFGRTLGELDESIKAKISHRARASDALLTILKMLENQ